jgi:two-component system, NarL family, sensor kinase
MFRIRKIVFLLGAFLLWQTDVLHAQGDIFTITQRRNDSTIQALKKFPQPDTFRIKALQAILQSAVFLRQKKQVIGYFDEAFGLCKKLNYTEGLADCYIWKGELLKSSEQFKEAHLAFDSAIALAASSPLLEEKSAFAYRQKGQIHFSQDDYYNALHFYFEALKYYEYHPDISTTALLTNITSIYLRLNNLAKALEFGKKNLQASQQTGKKMVVVQAQLGLVNIHLKKNDLASASALLDQIAPHIPDPFEMIINEAYYDRRGTIYYLQQKYDSSFAYYQQALRSAEKMGHSININMALYHLSDNALKLDKLEIAKKYALQNMELAKKIGTPGARFTALVNLSEYYNKTGNHQKAFQFLKEGAMLKDSVLSESNLKQMNTLGAIYETGKSQKEIMQLHAEKKLQTIQLKQKSNWNIFFIVCSASLLIMGLLAYKNMRKSQQLSQQQQALQRQLIADLEKDKKLLAIDSMLKGQEEERNRIAKDLHDGLGGMLSGVKLSFINMKENMILTPENLAGFERSIELLDSSIKELRKVAHNLMPEALVKFGLDEALKDFCHSIGASSQIHVVYQQFGELRKLTNTAEVFIYRIIQELVNNALKYAAAKTIMVQLTKYASKISITVEDDGKGFDTNTIEGMKGAGFSNIRYRVNYFKGTIDIVSGPGEGTSVNIELIA